MELQPITTHESSSTLLDISETDDKGIADFKSSLRAKVQEFVGIDAAEDFLK